MDVRAKQYFQKHFKSQSRNNVWMTSNIHRHWCKICKRDSVVDRLKLFVSWYYWNSEQSQPHFPCVPLEYHYSLVGWDTFVFSFLIFLAAIFLLYITKPDSMHSSHNSQSLSSMATPFSMHLFLLFIITVLNLESVLVQSGSDTYIIHMDVSAKPKSFSEHHSWYAATLSSLSPFDGSSSTYTPNLIYSYTNVVGGFCARLSDYELQLLENSPGFVSWTRDAPVTHHTTRTPGFLGLNSNSGIWPISKYGQNMIIGVIDSGVWPDSPSFKDAGMSKIPSRWKGKCVNDISFHSSKCNKKLIGARFYNKGLLAHDPVVNITVNTTRDTDGHGTHTASIAAGNYVKGASYFEYANGTASGVAPHAHLAIYKVLWSDHAYTSDVIAAIDQAIEDGVDVLSISMSWNVDVLYKDPIAIASFAAMEKGITVVTSAGNDGPQCYSLQNGAPWLLTVGAGSVDRTLSGIVTLGNGVTIIGTALYPLYSTIFKVTLVYVGDCDADDDKLQKNKANIVVCISDEYDLADQISSVERSQVFVAIFITSSNHVESELPTPFPAVFLNFEQGQVLQKYINSSNDPRASLDFHRTLHGIRPAPIVGDYSSRGPSRTNPSVLKPDLIAPGTLILSSWPKATPVESFNSGNLFSPFNILYGTSMACPHVAGVAALLKSAHPDWSPAAIRSAMMTTANPLDNTLKPIRDAAGLQVADPLVMGSGHIHPNKALDPGLVYDAHIEDYIRLLCSLGYTKKQMMTITRSSSFNCLNASSDLNYPSFIAFFNASLFSKEKVNQKFRRTVTNVGEGVSTYIANLTHINEVEVSVIPNKLVFKKKFEKLSFTLTVKGPRRLRDMLVYGSLSWTDVAGKHVVRSPIVATHIDLQDCED